MANFGILDALEIPFHRLGVHLPAIMEEHPFTQFERIGQQVWRDVPLLRNPRHWLRLQINVEETLGGSGEWR